MVSNSQTSSPSNLTFTTGVVAIKVGVLNPVNDPNGVWDCGVGMSYAAMTTLVSGGPPASFTILLEGTYDGTNWVTLATASNVSGETQFSTGLIPFTNMRARCTAVSGTANVSIYVTAAQTPFQNTGGGATPANNVTIAAPVDGNGNVKVSQQGSVDTAQVVNRYQSVSATGTSGAAPTAGTAIATVAVFDFYYKVDVVVGFGATAEITTADNFVLKAGAVTLYTLPAVNIVSNQSRTLTFYVNPGGAVNLTVNVGGTNGSAGSIYKATVTATRLI